MVNSTIWSGSFLRDFWRESKKGTLRHKKGIVIFFAFVFLCVLPLSLTAFKLSETPAFCGVCHNMKVYVDSWKASTHRKVACIECHYKPGFSNHLKGKWKDGQLSLAYFITGKGPTKPHAEIDDASCLQSGCHKRQDLKTPVVFKNVVFNHPQHIEQMRQAKAASLHDLSLPDCAGRPHDRDRRGVLHLPLLQDEGTEGIYNGLRLLPLRSAGRYQGEPDIHF